jgi:hypothetical protein
MLKVFLVLGTILIVYRTGGLHLEQSEAAIMTRSAMMKYDTRIWESYTTDAARTAAMQRVLPYIRDFVDTIQSNGQNNIWKTRTYKNPNACKTETFGSA